MATAKLFTDYYGILGVPRYTNTEGLRRAYVRKAWKHHPDLHPDDPDAPSAMSDINIAYATLSDPDQRSNYDSQRLKLHVGPSHARSGTSHSSRPRRRNPHKAPSPLDTALAMLMRLVRYATATLLM